MDEWEVCSYAMIPSHPKYRCAMLCSTTTSKAKDALNAKSSTLFHNLKAKINNIVVTELN